jgi:hypothetical protein
MGPGDAAAGCPAVKVKEGRIMTRIGVAFVAIMLSATAASRAADKGAPEVLPPATAVPGTPAAAPLLPVGEALHPADAPPAGACCTDCPAKCRKLVFWHGTRHTPSGFYFHRLLGWVTYCPLTTAVSCGGCGACCHYHCAPPLYAFFLNDCKEGCGCGSASRSGAGGCSAPSCVKPVCAEAPAKPACPEECAKTVCATPSCKGGGLRNWLAEHRFSLLPGGWGCCGTH